MKTKMIALICLVVVLIYCLYNNHADKYHYIYNHEALEIIRFNVNDYNKSYNLHQVKVAIIDEGLTDQSTINYAKLKTDSSGEVFSHGNIIANLLAANMDNYTGFQGLISDIQLYGYSLSEDEMNAESLEQAIRTTANWGVDIISISMGTSIRDDKLELAIQEAIDENIVVICSSGNNPYKNNYPASFDIPGLISVGAIGNDYNILPVSNANSYVDIYAPGENINSLNCATSQVEEFSGTSVAVPFVTLACVYIKAYYSSLSPKEIENLLIQKSEYYYAGWGYSNKQIHLLNIEQLLTF